MPRARRSVQARERGSTNSELSDREMLANIAEAIGADGWATTTEIAVMCGFTGNGRKSHTPATKVASRLSWMRLGGLLESTGPPERAPYIEPGSRDTRWRLTPVGREILGGKLSRTVESAIERTDPGTLILMMGQLTKRGWVEGDEAVAFALKRQYQHTQSKRQISFRMAKR